MLLKHYQDKFGEIFWENYFQYIITNEALILDREYYKETQNLFKKIDNIFLRGYDFYTQNLEQNLPKSYHIFIPYLKKRFLKKDFLVGRYDVLIDRNTSDLKIIEFNANTPGMITDIRDIARILKPRGYKNFSSSFEEYFIDKFKKYSDKKFGILLPYSYRDEDFLVGLDYKDMLQKITKADNIILGDIFESNIIDHDFYLKGDKIDILINFFPLEFFLTDLGYARDFLDIVKGGGLTLYNNIESLILQDKLIFAIIWENLDRYSPEDRDIIKKHIPYTSRVSPRDEDRYLAKSRFGRLSDGVYTMSDYYKHSTLDRSFVFQEKINSKLIDDRDNFYILGVFTNLYSMKAIVARRQDVFITNDDNVHIMNVYGSA